MNLWKRLRGSIPDPEVVRIRPWAWVSLGLILFVAFTLRVYRLGEIPAGLFCDEAANGYNAYSLLHTGRDEHGKAFPLFVWSFYAFKYPLDIYPSMIWVGLFGLTEFATRFQSALYGTLGVLVAFLIGQRMFRPLAGLAAALALALMPWHFHFSRIAFALTSFSFWFGLAFYFLVRAVAPGARRRDWLLAGAGFSFCFYAYAVAQIIVPLFVVAAVIFCARSIVRRPGWALQGAVVALLVALPFVIFYLRHLDRAAVYITQTSVLAQAAPLAEKLQLILRENYPVYYSKSFLLQQGDPILRHGARGFGVLHWAYVPWILFGILVLLVRKGSPYKLLLVWLLIFPLGAALTRETPSATRSAIGMLAFALTAGIGFERVVALMELIPWHWPRLAACGALGLAALYPLAGQAQRYLAHYFNEYPKYAAVGIEGFQYGYRDLFRVMEERRGEVDDLIYSTTSVNNPYILNLFYVRRPPRALNEWGDAETEYQGIRPTDVERWDKPGRRVLLAALDVDMPIFESWDERIDINGPSGQPAFIVLRNPRPKQFIEDWELIGPFPNPDNRNRAVALVEPHAMTPAQEVLVGPTRWEPYKVKHGTVDLNAYYGQRMPDSHNNPEFVLAYLRTRLRSPSARDVQIELVGSRDEIALWLNGEPVHGTPTGLDEIKVKSIRLSLRPGENILLVKTIETIGDWWYRGHIARPDGTKEPDVLVTAN